MTHVVQPTCPLSGWGRNERDSVIFSFRFNFRKSPPKAISLCCSTMASIPSVTIRNGHTSCISKCLQKRLPKSVLFQGFYYAWRFSGGTTHSGVQEPCLPLAVTPSDHSCSFSGFTSNATSNSIRSSNRTFNFPIWTVKAILSSKHARRYRPNVSRQLPLCHYSKTTQPAHSESLRHLLSCDSVTAPSIGCGCAGDLGSWVR